MCIRDSTDVIHLMLKLLNFRIRTLFVVTAISAVATAWCVDVNRRNAPRFLHVYLLRGAENLAIESVKIHPNAEFTFGHVPENWLSGKLEYKFGARPSLQFQTYGCSFTGHIRFEELIPAEVDPTIVDHVFIVSAQPDAQLALNAVNGG